MAQQAQRSITSKILKKSVIGNLNNIDVIEEKEDEEDEDNQNDGLSNGLSAGMPESKLNFIQKKKMELQNKLRR